MIILYPFPRSIKILSRKQDNRAIVGTNGLMAILMCLSPPLTPRIAAEAANALLNVCYEPENVRRRAWEV